MMTALREDVLQRIADGKSHFDRICSTRDQASIVRGKGLAFVEMYAVHEFATTSAMRLALTAMSSHSLKVSELRPGVLALAADDRLKSIQDSPIKTQWESRHSLFEWLSTATTADLNQQVFPKDGSHFK